jgi:NAD(P)-dependent dehydrogenase (short-subunit alcohol dehydrogenase family)
MTGDQEPARIEGACKYCYDLGSTIQGDHMELGIAGLRVMVTAGAGGIGLSVAKAFLSEGGNVYVCDIDGLALDALNKAHPEIGSSVCDVSDRSAVATQFNEAIKHFGGLDCLVNNAGIAGPTGPVHEIDPEEWDNCLAVCLTGQFNCARLAVAHLRRSSNASIFNLSSAALRGGEVGRSRVHQDAVEGARPVWHSL